MADQYDYSALEVKTAAILDRYGVRGCRVVRAGAGEPDEDAPWKPAGETPDEVIVSDATAVGDNIGFRRGKRDADQALTESAAGKAYLRGALATILPGDWLEVPIGGGEYERFYVSRAEPIKPGSVNVLWDLSLRS